MLKMSLIRGRIGCMGAFHFLSIKQKISKDLGEKDTYVYECFTKILHEIFYNDINKYLFIDR